MDRNQFVNELMRSSKGSGFITTLYELFGKSVKANISFTKNACDTSADELDFSVRTNNAMKRTGIFTFGEIVDIISNDELSHIRNLGKKTANEIKTRVLAYGYECLSEYGKVQFFYDFIEKNCM